MGRGRHGAYYSAIRGFTTEPAQLRLFVSMSTSGTTLLPTRSFSGSAYGRLRLAALSVYRMSTKLIGQMPRRSQLPLASEHRTYGASTEPSLSAEHRPSYWIQLREGVCQSIQPQQRHLPGWNCQPNAPGIQLNISSTRLPRTEQRHSTSVLYESVLAR